MRSSLFLFLINLGTHDAHNYRGHRSRTRKKEFDDAVALIKRINGHDISMRKGLSGVEQSMLENGGKMLLFYANLQPALKDQCRRNLENE
jgi:hypothetical protein